VQHRPVRARRESLLYRGRKFIKRHWTLVTAAAITAAVVFRVVSGIGLPAVPRVERVNVVAHRSDYYTGLASDGHRLFFVEQKDYRWTLAQTSVEGGPVTPIQTQFTTPRILDISPDQSELLLAEDTDPADESHLLSYPLWAMSTAGGFPRRLDR